MKGFIEKLRLLSYRIDWAQDVAVPFIAGFFGAVMGTVLMHLTGLL